jgi:hypothetical protein
MEFPQSGIPINLQQPRVVAYPGKLLILHTTNSISGQTAKQAFQMGGICHDKEKQESHPNAGNIAEPYSSSAVAKSHPGNRVPNMSPAARYQSHSPHWPHRKLKTEIGKPGFDFVRRRGICWPGNYDSSPSTNWVCGRRASSKTMRMVWKKVSESIGLAM